MGRGKTQLLPELRGHVPAKFNRYFEPFVGGGALFFDMTAGGWLDGKTAVLGDSNARLIACYRGIRDSCDIAIRFLRCHAEAYARDGADYYYKVRSQPYRLNDPGDAAWVIFMNKAGYNGLWRVNKKGVYNVPAGKFMRPPTILDEPNLRAVSAALQGVELIVGDFVDGALADYGDFVYFDPPYWPVSATADFTAYTKTAFGPAEQVRLRDYALLLKKRGAHVLLSNADVPPVRKLYAKGFECRRVEARRNVNSDASKRGAVGELLIW